MWDSEPLAIEKQGQVKIVIFDNTVHALSRQNNIEKSFYEQFLVKFCVFFKVWDLFYQADKVREMLTRLIQEESLRTYLFTYSHVYDSISMVTLSEMFELDRSIVHSIISKMIINEELMVSRKK